MAQRKELLLNAGAVFVAICTVLMVSLAVWERISARSPVSRPERPPPTRIENGGEIARAGHRHGPEDAELTVVVFSDFECPVCSVFAERTYPDLEARYPGRTALVFRHWPLSGHRFAYPAARAAECAAQQGRFFEIHDLLFSSQRQLGFKSFRDFASEAGVPDLLAFDACYSSREPVPAIERDIEAVRMIGGIGTPTVILNDWLLVGGVDPALLDSIARTYLPSPVDGLGSS